MSAQNGGAYGGRELPAPHGMRVVEHQLGGQARVRAAVDAFHAVEATADRVEVSLGEGGIWASVPPGGVEVHIHHGFEVVVSRGAIAVEAGSGDDGLLIVSVGEALLVDARGMRNVVAAGHAAVIGVTGHLLTVDRVGDDELAADPWVTANRALDEAVEPDLTSSEPVLVAPAVSGRGLARGLQVAAAVLLIGVTAFAVVLLRNDRPDTAIERAVSIDPTSTTAAALSSRDSIPTPATVPPGVKARLIACTQQGEALVAAGTIEGAPASARRYRIGVVVRLGEREFGSSTATFDRSDTPSGLTAWSQSIALDGDAIRAGARCEIRDVRIE